MYNIKTSEVNKIYVVLLDCCLDEVLEILP